jgi:hypothetical protein
MRGELGGPVDEMNLLRRHPERLPELQALIDFAGNKTDVRLPSQLIVGLMPAGWFYQNQYRCARMLEDYCIPVADANQGTFFPALARRGEAALAADTASPVTLYARLIVPVLGEAVRKFAYGQASMDLARTAMALERYQMARVELPEALEAVAPQFVAKILHDVIGGPPLKYRRERDALFVLYSVGWNETDDGGVAGLNKVGVADMQSGDWVWRY